MNIKSRVVIGASTALVLVAWFRDGRAAPNSPSGAPEPIVATSGLTALDQAIHAQAGRLRRRLDAAARPSTNRNPFEFVGAPSRTAPRHETDAKTATALTMTTTQPDAKLVLLGVAVNQRAGLRIHIAIIAGDADEMWMLEEGEMLGAQYRVTRIGEDAADLTDVVTGTTRQLVLR